MSKQDDQISAMVEKELRKDPGAKTADLQVKAAEIKKSVAGTGLRSFHGSHVGAMKRKISGKKGGRKKGAAKKRSIARSTPGLRAAIDSLVEAEIKKARGAFDATLDSALKKARKTGRVADFERIHRALLEAREAIGKV